MKRRRTVQPLPDYTRRKPLAGGKWGYYFEPPTWARRPKQGDDRGPCPVGPEHLGTDYAAAVARVERVLLPAFDSWRTRGSADLVSGGPARGSLDWLFAEYRTTTAAKKLGPKVRSFYERGFALVAEHRLTDGRRLGEMKLSVIDARAVDALYAALLPKRDKQNKRLPLIADGKPVRDAAGSPVFVERRTTVNHAMRVCRRAWNVVERMHRSEVPGNPFARMGLVSATTAVTAASYADLVAAVAKADELDLFSLGTALMVTWEWLQREEHIFRSFELAHYRPRARPDEVYVVHPKNGEAVWIPLFDHAGTPLFPELMARMDRLKRDRVGAGPFFLRDWIDRKASGPVPWATPKGGTDLVKRKARFLLDAAGIDPQITFTSFRHGGMTELGDADLTDAQIRAISRHKSPNILTRYVKRTDRQIVAAIHKRRASRLERRTAVADDADQLELFKRDPK